MLFSVEVFQDILFLDHFGTQYGFLPYNQYTQKRKRTARMHHNGETDGRSYNIHTKYKSSELSIP